MRKFRWHVFVPVVAAWWVGLLLWTHLAVSAVSEGWEFLWGMHMFFWGGGGGACLFAAVVCGYDGAEAPFWEWFIR